MNKFEFKNLTPFKWFVLENFPFIEADFDALTEWQLFCKLGKEINKIIDSQNIVGEQAETLTNAFNNLKNYVDNYFKNLDVQDEINNKLNEMAQSGQLTDIIAQYLQLAGLLCFNTKEDLKNAENLIDGSFAKTFGNLTYNDGYGNYYKIRKIRNTDVIDDINIIALTNDIDLVAELIPNNYLKDSLEIVNNEMEIINNKINKIDYFNLELQPNIIYDLADDSHSQGSCVIGNILYVYVESNFPIGDIYKFDIENCTFIEKITNKKLYHGNDMCAVGNNIYVASCKDDSENFTNKTIVVFNTLNNTVTEINPFENIDKTYIFALAKYNEETLICALTNSQNFNDLGLYLYNINNGNITEISITNTDNIPTNIFYAFQSMEILDNKIFLMNSLNDNLIELELNDNIANVNKIYNLPLIDSNNQIVGEYEGISKCEIFGKNALIITSIIIDNTYDNHKTIKAYIINPINNLSNSKVIYPNILYTTSNEQRNIIYLKKTSTSLFENGTSNFPFKTLSRALRGINAKTSINNLNIVILDSENYYIDMIINKKVSIISDSQNSNEASLYIKRIIDSDILFSTQNSSNKINIYLTDGSDGSRIDLNNSKVKFLGANIYLINRTWLSMTHLMIFNSTVNKMPSFSATDVHLWLESNASIVQDSADYGNIANPWHRLAGDSILYALGNSLSANYSTKVDKTLNSVLIVSGTYHN